MTYMIDGYKVEQCLRCSNTDLLASYPVLFCKHCGSIMTFNNNGLYNMSFSTGSYYVRIIGNVVYVNGKEIGVTSIPFDISDEKLHTYLVFS